MLIVILEYNGSIPGQLKNASTESHGRAAGPR
jgi:hypothetical protein